jgi:hypothetical protein
MNDFFVIYLDKHIDKRYNEYGSSINYKKENEHEKFLSGI